MSCIEIDMRTAGFSLVELMVVVSIIALLSAIAGNTLTDQLNQQRVADAIERARFLASILAPIQPQLTDPGFSCNFPVDYSETLRKFMTQMEVGGCQDIKDILLSGVDIDADVLGLKAGDAYRIEISDHSVFVSFLTKIQYSDMDFYSASKVKDLKASTVTWTVADNPIDFVSSQLSRLSNINTVR